MVELRARLFRLARDQYVERALARSLVAKPVLRAISIGRCTSASLLAGVLVRDITECLECLQQWRPVTTSDYDDNGQPKYTNSAAAAAFEFFHAMPAHCTEFVTSSSSESARRGCFAYPLGRRALCAQLEAHCTLRQRLLAHQAELREFRRLVQGAEQTERANLEAMRQRLRVSLRQNACLRASASLMLATLIVLVVLLVAFSGTVQR